MDDLTRALNHFRPKLDRALPIAERSRNFYAICVAVRKLAASDVLRDDLTVFARRRRLIHDLGRNGSETVDHLIRYGLLKRWPFGRGQGAA